MRKPTIYNIRNGYEALGKLDGSPAHFFDHDTLRFFHETLSDLKVSKTDNPKVFKVVTRHNTHYFEAVGDGYPHCYYRHIETYEALPR